VSRSEIRLSCQKNDDAKFSDAKQHKALVPIESTPPVKPVRPAGTVPEAKALSCILSLTPLSLQVQVLLLSHFMTLRELVNHSNYLCLSSGLHKMTEARPSTPELYDLRPCGPREDTKEAVRVLVQTRTHLLPGADYYEKLTFMLDLICNHVWGRLFIPRRDRFHLYGPPFGCKNHRFYFVVDHGQARDDSIVPVLWYQFTGAGDPL
jgi:hypothetical protein